MSEPPRNLSVAPAKALHGGELAALFERSGCTCFCRWWHFQGDKNAWLERCVSASEESRREMVAALHASSDELQGMVAVAETGRVVGWMKLCPADAIRKLYSQRLYRGLACFDGDRRGILTIGCFLIEPEWRKKGVARALLAGGIDAARASGARAIEAFPRRADPLSAEEAWTGPLGAFLEAGFEEVHAFLPYPVLRRTLRD